MFYYNIFNAILFFTDLITHESNPLKKSRHKINIRSRIKLATNNYFQIEQTKHIHIALLTFTRPSKK